ncbi:MAG: Cna B domain protein, partial [uncultured Sulfurovum sp.]
MNIINKNIFLKLLVTLVLMSIHLFASVSGTVFRDLPVNGTVLNSYGVKDANELGVENIKVTAYPENISTVTASDGSWSLATTLDSRIEFSDIPDYLKESPDGQNKNSSIRFVANGGTADFALHNPNNYSHTVTPKIFTPVYTNGDGQKGGTSASMKTIGFLTYGENTAIGDSGESLGNMLSTNAEVGALWGIAFNKTENHLYTSAVVRRHVGFGTLGIGGIYRLENALSNAPTVVPWLDLNTLAGIDVGTDPRDGSTANSIPADFIDPSWDATAYHDVGRSGLGAIDISEDDKILYVVNLNNKELIAIDIETKTMHSGYPIPIPAPATGCSNGEHRPWGLEIHDGDIYAGVVCSAEAGGSADDLSAHVLKLNGATFDTTPVLSLDLDYARGNIAWGNQGEWEPWTVNDYEGYVHPQAILSDMKIDEKGDMILGFLDKLAMSTGANNYDNSGTSTSDPSGQSGGDLLRACLTSGIWVMENNGECGGISTAGVDADPGSDTTHEDQGIGGGEYYWGDDKGTPAVHVSEGAERHTETSFGGLSLLMGSNEVLVTVMDPLEYDSSGVKIFNNDTGANTSQYSVTSRDAARASGRMGKAAGIGDVEILSNPAPIEVGNRVWEDIDSDGIQDANESAIASVSVELVCGGVVASTAVTDASGHYIFSNDPDGVSTGSHKYNVTELVLGVSNCLLRVPNVSGASKQVSLGTKILTTQDVGEGSNANLNDSDGIAVSDNADVSILAADLEGSGANNHTFDFGFKPDVPTVVTVGIGSLIWEDLNGDGNQDDNEPGIEDVNVTLLDSTGVAVATSAMQTTLADGRYYFSNLTDNESYAVKVSPPSGYVACSQQTDIEDITENDSNIKTQSGNEYTSAVFALQSDTELTESNGKTGTDDADDADDDNGDMTVDFCFYKPVLTPEIDIEKATNGNDADTTSEAVALNEGDVVTWSYVVTNTGAVDLTTIAALDDKEGAIACPKTALVVGESMTCTSKIGTAVAGEYTNEACVSATDGSTTVNDCDKSNYKASVILSSLGDTVWYDDNKDGVQDSTEKGVEGVKVTLYEGDCSTKISDQVTNSSGTYIFSDLTPSDYCLGFTDLPSGYQISPKDNGGTDSTDSDVDPLTGKTVQITLPSNVHDLIWDMGIYADKLASLGDTVWYDDNQDGIQDATESGVNGVQVTLLEDCDDGKVVSTTVTDEKGTYIFR